jgi:hypothetical protein
MTMNTPVLRGAVSYAGGGTAPSGARSAVTTGGTIGGGSDERGSILRVVPVALVSVHCAEGGDVAGRGSTLRAAVVAPESHDASASAGGVADVGVGAADLPIPAGMNAVSSPNATGAAVLAALGVGAADGVTIIDSSSAGSMRGVATGALELGVRGEPVVPACRALGGVAVVADVAVVGVAVVADVDGVAVGAGASAGACAHGGVLRVPAWAIAAVTVVGPAEASPTVAWAAPQWMQKRVAAWLSLPHDEHCMTRIPSRIETAGSGRRRAATPGQSCTKRPRL